MIHFSIILRSLHVISPENQGQIPESCSISSKAMHFLYFFNNNTVYLHWTAPIAKELSVPSERIWKKTKICGSNVYASDNKILLCKCK